MTSSCPLPTLWHVVTAAPYVDIHGLKDEDGDDVRAVVHGGIMHKGESDLVLFAQPRHRTLPAQGHEDGHQATLGGCLQTIGEILKIPGVNTEY